MKKLSLGESLVLAGGLTVFALPLHLALSVFLPSAFAFRLLWSTLVFIYLWVGVGLRKRRIGTGVSHLAVLTLLAASAVVNPIDRHLLCCALVIWAARSVWCYGSLATSAVDLFVSLTSIGFTSWTFGQTGSAIAALWSFFLVQSLTALIPYRFSISGEEPRQRENRFDQAYGSAERALRQIIGAA
ncbi:MAG: hypothetical protein U0136_12165 [Bdellovibrionota bacterium]